MNTNQATERAVGNARKITERGYNLDRLVELIASHDDPKSIAQRISEANFNFIELLTSVEHVDATRFTDSFFVLREVFEAFNEMEEEANQGAIIVVPKTDVQQRDEFQTTKDNNANEEIRGLRVRCDAVWGIHEADETKIAALNELIASKNELVNELQEHIEFLKSKLSDRSVTN